jgi:hypothetical protein
MRLITVIVSRNSVTPKINAKIVDSAKNVPSVNPKGCLDSITPMSNLLVNAKIKAIMIEKFEISAIQKLPVKRLGNSLSISIFPILRNASPRLYMATVSTKSNQ